MPSATARRLLARLSRRPRTPEPLVTLRRGRIYILPTRFGVTFAILVFAMLLGSINYGASLGFALTFLLLGLLLVAMHECHRNLLGLRLRFAGSAPAFAGGVAELRIAVSNDAASARYEIVLGKEGRGGSPVDVPPGETRLLTLRLAAPQRGWLSLGPFTVATAHPGRLFRAWSWVNLEARALIYPAPVSAGRLPPPSPGGAHAHPAHRPGEEDFAGLRPAVSGDPPKRIAWKAYARSGILLAKQFADTEHEQPLLDWEALAGLDTEARLSQLTRWCLDAAAEGRNIGLRLPSGILGPATGEGHLHACLRALALFEGSTAAEGKP